jgi:hypothetical protein
MLAIIQSKIFCLPVSYKKLNINIYKAVILPVVLYGCETWFLTLRVFENRVWRRIFAPKREEDRSWRELHNDTVFGRLNTGIVGSSPLEVWICVRVFLCCVVLCVGRGFASGQSPVQGVLPIVQIDI